MLIMNNIKFSKGGTMVEPEKSIDQTINELEQGYPKNQLEILEEAEKDADSFRMGCREDE